MPFADFLEENYDSSKISEETVAQVTKIFSEVLGIDKTTITPHQHFIFDLGGTSLDYISLLVKMKATFDMDFSYSEVSLSTVAEFSAYIMKQKSIN